MEVMGVIRGKVINDREFRPNRSYYGDWSKNIITRIENGKEVYYCRKTGKRFKIISIEEFLKPQYDKEDELIRSANNEPIVDEVERVKESKKWWEFWK